MLYTGGAKSLYWIPSGEFGTSKIKEGDALVVIL